MILTAPSIISADFARLGEELVSMKAAGGDWVHYDVMDGRFVNNMSMGLAVLKSIRKDTDMYIDVHLMIVEPQTYAERYCRAGADGVTVHYESASEENILKAIADIRACGKKAGIAISPKTPASAIRDIIPLVDLVLIMTVEPGFGGQSFRPELTGKISEVRAMIDASNPGCHLEIDGGMNGETAALVREAGADVIIAGTYFFRSEDRKAAVESLKG